MELQSTIYFDSYKPGQLRIMNLKGKPLWQ
jgi:hypothetical protein